ncbi:hypothetical protein NPIL_253671, partial [Nephila pilipes]
IQRNWETLNRLCKCKWPGGPELPLLPLQENPQRTNPTRMNEPPAHKMKSKCHGKARLAQSAVVGQNPITPGTQHQPILATTTTDLKNWLSHRNSMPGPPFSTDTTSNTPGLLPSGGEHLPGRHRGPKSLTD